MEKYIEGERKIHIFYYCAGFVLAACSFLTGDPFCVSQEFTLTIR